MEDWEEEHINQNLSKLLKSTNISPGFLAELKSFSRYEIDSVQCEKTDDDKAWKLFATAKTKPGGYDELTIAFNEHKMLGPLKIMLEGYTKNGKPCPLDNQTSSGINAGSRSGVVSGNPTSSGKKFDSLVVGNDGIRSNIKGLPIHHGCTREDVTETVRECKSFARFRSEWRTVASDLAIPDDLIDGLADDFLVGGKIKSLRQLLDQLLLIWIGEKGDGAKMMLLCEAFRKNHLTDIAQSLEKKFG